MDKVFIRGLKVNAKHGVHPEEKEKAQPFLINAELYLELSPAGESDELDRTVNYSRVCRFISEWMLENTRNLLEACAEELCRALLEYFPSVSMLWLELQKPKAPIPLDFDTVGVCLERGRSLAWLGLGSNLGNSEAQIFSALSWLDSDPGINLIRTSSLIKTAPYGGVEQPDFINGVCLIETLYSPEKFLALLKETEIKAGRVPSVHWGPRALDLDILFYKKRSLSCDRVIEEHVILNTPRLTIPHKDMHNRAFVLEPLCELAPELIHPLFGETVFTLLSRL